MESGRFLSRHHRSIRPPAAMVLTFGFVAALSAMLVLSFSDRAPEMAHRIAFRLEVADEIDRWSFGLDPDLIGHAALWGGLALLVGMALRRYTGWIAAAMAALVGLSVLVEEGQRRYTTLRSFQMKDIVANGIGIAVAFVLVCVLVDRQVSPVRSVT